MTTRYMPELDLYGPPEPIWVINNRRRLVGQPMDPYYRPGAEFGPYSRGLLVPDVHLKAPIYTLEDIARIKDALALEGVYNVICDIPDQTVIVSTRLSPSTITSLVRQVIGEATLINVVEPYPLTAPVVRPRYSAYDDMYTYPSIYAPVFDPYSGRSYDNEFRPARYYTGY